MRTPLTAAIQNGAAQQLVKDNAGFAVCMIGRKNGVAGTPETRRDIEIARVGLVRVRRADWPSAARFASCECDDKAMI
jgi:hypothetical protein